MYEMGDFELHSTESVFQTGLDFLESDHFEEALRAFDYIIGQQPYNADAHFHRGIALVNLSRAREAIVSYRAAIEISPNDASLYTHLGYAMLISGSVDEALETLDVALGLQPEGHQARIYKACALAEKRQFGAAREILEDLLVERPEEIEALRHYAAILAALGEEEKALQQLAKILRKHPNNREALRNRAIVLLRQSKRKDAVRSLRELTAVAPDDANAWMLLLETLADSHAWPELVAQATHAMEAGHESSEVYMLRGRAYLETGSADHAVANLWRSRELNDRNPEVFFHLAHALMIAGKLRHGMKNVNRAIQMKPDDRRFMLLKGELHHRLGEHASELQLVSAGLEARPDDFDFLRQKVRCFASQNRMAEAAAFVDRFIVRLPNHTAALLLGADLSEKLAQADKAHRYYSRIFQSNPVGSYAYQLYAAFLMREQMPERAIAVLNTAKLEHPTDSAIEAARVMALQSVGRYFEAAQHIEDYLTLDPATSELHWLASKSYFALERYDDAESHLKQARAIIHLDPKAVVPVTWLAAEAIALHKAGKTADGVLLLEKYIPRETYASLEHYLALGEMCELGRWEPKALTIYGQALQAYPNSAQIHYRISRNCALLGKKSSALEHLRLAVELDASIIEMALVEPAFKRYSLSPAMTRTLGVRFVSRKIRLAGAIAGWGIGILVLANLLE